MPSPVKSPLGSSLDIGPNATSGEFDGAGFLNPRCLLTVTPAGPMVLPWIVEVRFAGGQWLTVATGLVASQVFLSFPIPHPGFSFGAPLAGGSMRIRNTDAAQTVAAFYAIHEAAGVSG